MEQTIFKISTDFVEKSTFLPSITQDPKNSDNISDDDFPLFKGVKR